MAWIRRVRTASGATAVQIAEYDGGRRKIVAHVGSAHTEAELGILLGRAREMLADPALWGCITRPPVPDLGFYPARSYSLRRPPRTGRRWIRSWERSATG